MSRRLALSLALVGAAIAATCAVDPSPANEPSIESGNSTARDVPAPLTQVDNAYALASKVTLPETKPNELEGLHNVFKLGANLISGSEPHGDEAFRQLAAMGVKTILSVDGKAPEVELAASHGIRYVHVPIEYRGISDEELVQLAKSYRECEGPFYVHCFHGKHRGPAAAAIGRLVLDGIPREEAIAEMRQWCGTAPEYEGLYRDVAMKPIPTAAESRAYEFAFPSRRSFGGFREAMIDVSRRDDALKAASKRGWAVDPHHPDIDLVNEAAQLADAFKVSGTMTEVRERPQDFHGWLDKSVELSTRLTGELEQLKAGDAAAAELAKKSYAELAKTCVACHESYRNH